MQITLVEDEILQAIEQLVRSQIQISQNQDLKIDLKATRGEAGITAVLEIAPSQNVKTSAGVSAMPKTAPRAVVEEAEEPPAAEEVAEEKPAKAVKKKPFKAFGGDDSSDDEDSEAEADGSPEAIGGAPADTEEAPKPRSIFSKVAS